MTDKCVVIDTPEGIEMYRLLALRSALQLECKGLRFRGGSAVKTVRELIGSKTRSREKLLAELDGVIEGAKAQYGRKN
ncbi:MAG: hypothetical protein HGB04_06610 [Chlorobiaceae bacterium]|nr:hypothetical protein [Chlorobiaceae bacterium]NTV02443.1 hypothetical protein [Chlorobiaceae bacterium]